eukprot:scaffold277436_cov32-Tisochrysis_lutea.AAC.1
MWRQPRVRLRRCCMLWRRSGCDASASFVRRAQVSLRPALLSRNAPHFCGCLALLNLMRAVLMRFLFALRLLLMDVLLLVLHAQLIGEQRIVLRAVVPYTNLPFNTNECHHNKTKRSALRLAPLPRSQAPK